MPFPPEEVEDASEPTKRDRSHLESTLKLNEDKPADDFSGEGAWVAPSCALPRQSLQDRLLTILLHKEHG